MINQLTEILQVNIPFTMLCESYLDLFTTHRLNPEIGFDADALDNYSLSDVASVGKQIRDAGLTTTLHAPFMDLSPGSPDPKFRALTRKRLEQVVRLIPLFKPKTVVCHTGYDPRRYGDIKDIWVKNSLETWSSMAKQIRSEGAILMMENVYEQGPDDIFILLENLKDHKVGFCLDTGHQNVFSAASIETWITSLGVYLGQLHLHDNDGKADEHLALGRGCVDFPQLFKHLTAENDTRPVVTLEPHREEELWPSLKYLERIWPW